MRAQLLAPMQHSGHFLGPRNKLGLYEGLEFSMHGISLLNVCLQGSYIHPLVDDVLLRYRESQVLYVHRRGNARQKGI